MEPRSVGVCPAYEPHIWRRNKCKNCFHSKSEHKRLSAQKSFVDNGRIEDPALHLDFVDGMNVSDEALTPRIPDVGGSGDKTRKDYKEELKYLRRERKDIAGKQAELRETMLRMEVQMHDYKETKQENDILTKDIQLMKKDLREVTQGAAKACEMNEKLRKEVSRLRQMVRSLGGDPRSINGSSSCYDSESAAESSDYASPPIKNRKKELDIKIEPIPRPKHQKPLLTDRPTLNPSELTSSENSSAPLPRSVRERMARMEEHLSSLRSVCISITNTPPNESKEVVLSFVESVIKGLEAHCMNFVRKMYTQRATSTPAFSLGLRKNEMNCGDAVEFPNISDIDVNETHVKPMRTPSTIETEIPEEPTEDELVPIPTVDSKIVKSNDSLVRKDSRKREVKPSPQNNESKKASSDDEHNVSSCTTKEVQKLKKNRALSNSRGKRKKKEKPKKKSRTSSRHSISSVEAPGD